MALDVPRLERVEAEHAVVEPVRARPIVAGTVIDTLSPTERSYMLGLLRSEVNELDKKIARLREKHGPAAVVANPLAKRAIALRLVEKLTR